MLEESELKEIRRIANNERLTVAEWVRQVLRSARKEHPARDRAKKLAAIRRAAKHHFPAPDIEQMLEEIERGYLGKE